jgi:hypothetical protein
MVAQQRKSRWLYAIRCFFSYSFNFSSAIKATLRGGVINITDEDNVKPLLQVDPNDKSNTVVVNKSLGMTPNVALELI